MILDEKKIFSDIVKGKPVEIKFYENEDSINSLIKSVIIKVLEKYGQNSLSDVIYGCIKELIINATKANVKRAFFKRNNLDINDMGEYIHGITKFKIMLDSKEYKNYYEELYLMDLWVKFNIRHNKDGIIFEVSNNSSIVEIEDRRIRMKLQKSMIYDDFIKYYHNEKDSTEGDGIGIALVIFLMGKANLDPSLFRLGTVNDITVSRIELPLTMNYKYMRKEPVERS